MVKVVFENWRRRREERLLGTEIEKLDKVLGELTEARIKLAGVVSQIRQAREEGLEEEED